MDFVDLPIVDRDASLADAVAAMRASGRRAVVVRRQAGEYHLYSNREIAAAWRRGGSRIADLPPSQRPVVSLAAASATGERRIEEALDAEGAGYGFTAEPPAAELPGAPLTMDRTRGAGASAPRLIVVTRHESYAHEIRSAGAVCCCSGPRHHDPPAGASDVDGAPCDFCDGVYECF